MALRMLMIGGWTSIFEKAKSNGFDLTVIQRPQAIKPEDLAVVDQLVSCPLNDQAVVDIAASIHKHRPFDAVVSFQELGLLNAALISERLNIVGNPMKPVILTRDKGLMREHLKENNIPSIPFAITEIFEDAIVFGEQHGWPIIVKPKNGVGSLHIHKLQGPEHAKYAFQSINNDPIVERLIKKEFPDLGVIAEKFVEGPEVSVEAITWEGAHTILVITDKLHSGSPHFVETGHSMPSQLTSDTQDAICDITIRFLNSIGHMYGPSHTEIIVTAEGPIIIESHTRNGGDNIFEMVELACGIDLFDATLKGFAGAFPKIELTDTKTVAIRYWMPPEKKVTEISGLDYARSASGVVRCELRLKPDDPIKSLRYSDDRPGYILAVGNEENDAIKNVNSAMEMVTITLDDEVIDK